MLSSIPCGDFELNIAHPQGMPTLVPSPALEQRLDWRLQQSNCSNPTSTGTEPSPLPPLAVHLHVHYLETLPTLLNALEACRSGLENLRLWISTDSSAKAEVIGATLQQSSITELATTVEVRICPNRGRNLGPLLIHLWPELKQEALVLHLHGKRSLENDLGDAWLNQLLKRLLPDGDIVLALRQQFHIDPNFGLAMPQPPNLIRPYLNWGMNFELASQLAKSMEQPIRRDAVLVFPAGGMFWARPAALAPLTQCMDALETLPPEPLPVDGSSLHAIERLVAHACEVSEHQWRLALDTKQSTASTAASLSVLNARPNDFQQATSLLALHYRQKEADLKCSETNLARCNNQLTEQINSAGEQLLQAGKTIKELDQTLHQRNQEIQTMASSWGMRLTRLLKRLARVGT